MTVLTDVRYALRLFVSQWRFSLTLVVTLACGIAASGVIFNVLNASLFRPLPIPHEDRVYRLLDATTTPGGQRVTRTTRILNFLDIREQARSFDAVAGMRSVEWTLAGGGLAVPVRLALVSPGSFDLLGARAHAGRLFTSAEEDTGVDSGALVLSYALWQRQFGGRHEVIGSSLRLEERAVTIVGVLPPGFHFPYRAEAWMPERIDARGEASLATFARLAPGASPAQAQTELDAIAKRAEAVRPDANRGMFFTMTPVREQFVGDQARTSFALAGAAALLLLLSVANVTNLLLARGIRRAREIGIRAALGASRWAQVRQLLVESTVYAAAGTAAGLAAAAPLSLAVVGLVPSVLRDELGLAQATIDWRAAMFAAAVTAIAGVLAGLAPALRLARTDINSTLGEQGRGTTGGHRLMRGLVVGEVSLAVVLLLTAGLMADNLQRLLSADLGIETTNVVSMRSPVPLRYDTAERRIALARALEEAASALPGMERAGLVTVNPLARGSFGSPVETEDDPLAPGETAHIVNHRLVMGDWFRTAGVRLLRGRVFSREDSAASAPVTIVSERMAERLWPGADPLGRRVRQPRPGAPWLTVVGIVGNVRDSGDWEDAWYVPYEQHAATFAGATLHIMLRTNVEPGAALAALREAMVAIDPQLPVTEPTLMSSLWVASQEQQQLGTLVATLFAVSGLLLAALGTYGVLSYLVSARSREFGIRLALGAGPARVLHLVLRDGFTLVAAGLTIGGLISLAAVRALQNTVAIDYPGVPMSLPIAVVLVLGGSAFVASIVPARRATRIAPVDVMRSE